MRITFMPMNRNVDVQKGENLLQAANHAGIDLNGVCAGNGTCGKCKVIISKGNDHNLTTEELNILTREEIGKGVRLACCYQVNNDICVIMEHLPSNHNKDQNQATRLHSTDLSKNSLVGIAFDIGTTCVEAAIYDLASKKMINNKTVDNPQRIYGADVVSRISYIYSNPDGLDQLHSFIIRCCNHMIHQMMTECGLSNDQIKQIAVAGNTTMTYIFAKKNVKCLFKAPFQLEFKGGVIRSTKELGLECMEGTKLFLPQLIGGHVGSDTLGCILETKVYEKQGVFLIVDVGTNGEIVLAKNGQLTACSTAAGPAFEGASILHGMRADTGAIIEAKMNQGYLDLVTVGNAAPKGICGSGLIDIVGELLEYDMIDEMGRLPEDYILYTNPDGSTVKLVQKDIRELQLAKAAIFAGINVLLRNSGVDKDDIDIMYIAGAFGSHLNIQKAARIGLLPELSKDKVQCIGNASLSGMSRIVMEEIDFEKANEIARQTQHLELANMADFTEEYLNWINFTK